MRASLFSLATLAMTVSAAGNFTFDGYSLDIANVDVSDRADWCRAQRNLCRDVCGKFPQKNNCEAEDLSSECKCEDGKTPELDDYSESLEAYACRATADQCTTKNAGDADKLDTCEKIRDTCGSKSFSSSDKQDDGESSTTTSSSSSDSSPTSDSSDDEDNSDDGDDGNAAVSVQMSGALALVAAMCAIVML